MVVFERHFLIEMLSAIIGQTNMAATDGSNRKLNVPLVNAEAGGEIKRSRSASEKIAQNATAIRWAKIQKRIIEATYLLVMPNSFDVSLPYAVGFPRSRR
jgi:hypothetical protein